MPSFSVCGTLQARILEWVASRGSSWPRDQSGISCDSFIIGGFFTIEPPGKPSSVNMSVLISHFIPSASPHFPLVTISFFSTSVTPFLFYNKLVCNIFLDSTYKKYYMIFISLYRNGKKKKREAMKPGDSLESHG